MSDVEIEVVGGPEDGKVFVLPGHPGAVSWPLFPGIEATIVEAGEMPVVRTITFDIHQRDDGSFYINYWEGKS